MFGYVTFYKDELKIKDFNNFRAYYCGLCKELGKRFNQLVRLGLSYDLTFLAILLDSVSDEKTEFAERGCFKHIGRKRKVAENNESIGYAADMSIALMYYKLADDIRDSFSPLSVIAILPYWASIRKVRRKYPEKLSVIKDCLKKLTELEKQRCNSTDRAAEPFAKIMEQLFDIGNDRVREMGYNIGRFIYLIDGADDYEKDLKSGNYNPYVCAYPQSDVKQIKEAAARSLTFTLAKAAECYESLELKKNKDLLDNIIYLGLRLRMDTVLEGDNKKKGNKNGKSI